MAERRVINPWTWQDEMGFAQAIEITGARRELVCSGQTSVDADGRPLHPGDMRAQAAQALDNLETVLHAAGFTLSDIVRLNFYVTDVDAFFGALDVIGARLGAAGVKPPGSLLGITRLAFPELVIEMEATAMA